MKVSIIIPTYNRFDLLKTCLDSVERYTDLSDKEIVVVSNGCKDETVKHIKVKQDSSLPYKLLEFPRPIGFPKAVNIGALASSGEYIIILNNDAFITGSSWIDLLFKPFLIDPSVAATGPIKMADVEIQIKIEFPFWYIVFFCVLIKRSIYEELNGLDEFFTPGRGEDTDFCIRALKKGYKLIKVPDEKIKLSDDKRLEISSFPIYHEFGNTFKNLDCVGETDKRNKEYLIEKHRK